MIEIMKNAVIRNGPTFTVQAIFALWCSELDFHIMTRPGVRLAIAISVKRSNLRTKAFFHNHKRKAVAGIEDPSGIEALPRTEFMSPDFDFCIARLRSKSRRIYDPETATIAVAMNVVRSTLLSNS